MERCPACNARLKELLNCPRCKADLSAIINAENTATFWQSKAIQFFLDKEWEQSIKALEYSLHRKDSHMAKIFRKYLIDYQCREILDLLAQKKLLSAKKLLFRLRNLLPLSQQLQQLNDFTDYLLVKAPLEII